MASTETAAVITHNAAATGTTGFDMNAANYRGALVYVNITALTGTSPTLTVTIQAKTPVSGVYYTVLASAALTATGLTVLRVYPGLAATANLSANDILPASYRVITAIGGTTPAVTATVSAVLVD